jgi:hypothetical protein
MKSSAQFLRRNEVIKFSNSRGTHTMIVENVQRCFKGREVQVSGTIIKTTNNGNCKISGIKVGDSYYNFFRVKTKVQIVK